jgi:hypothetical protein
MPKSLDEYLMEGPAAPGMGDVRLADDTLDVPRVPSPGMGDARLADRAFDIPAPPVPKVPRVSLGSVDLASKADNGALRQAVGSPSPLALQAAAAQKAAPADPDAELLAAQRRAANEGGMSHLGGLMDRAARTIIGLQPDDAVFARGEQAAQQGVQDLIQRREQARKAVEDQRARDSEDPNSDVSQRATRLAQAQGLIPAGMQITAAQWKDLQGGASVQAQREAAAANNNLANAQFGYQRQHDAAQMSQQAREAQAQREFQMALHASDKDADLRKALLEAEAKKAEKSALKPLPVETNQKIAGTLPAAQSLNTVWDKFSGVDALDGVNPLSAASRSYGDTVQNAAGPIAAGELPNARETPALVEHFHETLPSAIVTKERAAQNILGHFNNLETKLESELQTNKGYDTSGIEAQLQAVRAEKAKFTKNAAKFLPQAAPAAPGVSPAPAAKRPTRTDPRTGETREWDGSAWVPVGGK